jgi:hypothetical protein
VACVVLGALFWVRPQAGSLRGRVSQLMSRALGREVEIHSLQLRFLPRPGFVLDDVVVRDDPAFGAEPLVRAPEVTAWLRVGALFWGRLEISSLSLADASLNLTGDAQGRWNFEELVDRTSRVATAPTASRGAKARPKFPYIEATQARINWKVGSEKTHFAFINADFALWQETENAWGMRLRARPIRTDANLTDTGTVLLSGLWQRSAVLSQTPLQFSFVWNQAQIGQVSKLIYGVDKGWRGSVALSGTATGTPATLKIMLDSSVDDFRRHDVLGGQDLRLRTHCGATYSTVAKRISNLDCVAPVGSGVVEVKGGASIRSWPWALSSYDLWFVATGVPAQSVLTLAGHSRASFSRDVAAGGVLAGSLEISRGDGADGPRWQGHGTVQGFELSSNSSASIVRIETLPLTVASDASVITKKVSGGARPQRARNRIETVAPLARQPRIELGPVNLAWGGQVPLEARALLSRSGYQASLRGEAGLKRLLEAARLLAIPRPSWNAEGSAALDLHLEGSWLESNWPRVLGSAQLHGVYAQVRGMNAPLAIGGATLLLLQDRVKVQNLNVLAAESRWRGNLEIARPCTLPSACQIQFNLHTQELNAAALNRFLNPAFARKNWYRFLSLGKEQPPYLLEAHAGGRLAVDRLRMGELVCSHVGAQLQLDGGEVTLERLQGELLGGKATGEVKADFARRPPVYSGSGDLKDVSLAPVAELMHDLWIDGTGNAHLELTTAGQTVEDLLHSASLRADFLVSKAVFPHVVLTAESGPLHATRFSGMLRLDAGQFSFEDAQLEVPTSVYKVSGTALLDGRLDLKLAGETPGGFNVTGTLLKTRVSPIPTAQASLKP